MTAIWRDETDTEIGPVPMTMGYWCRVCHMLHYRTDYEYDKHMGEAVYPPQRYCLPIRERVWRAAMGRPQVYGAPKKKRAFVNRPSADSVVVALCAGVSAALLILHRWGI